MLSASQLRQAETELFGPPKTQFARFYPHARKNGEKTESAGYPVFDRVIYVSIRNEGERDTFSREANDEDKARFPQQWAAFCQWAENVEGKTPIAALPGHDVCTMATFRELGIATVEQLLETESLPEPLEPFMVAARRLRQLSKPHLKLVNGKYEAA